LFIAANDKYNKAYKCINHWIKPLQGKMKGDLILLKIINGNVNINEISIFQLQCIVILFLTFA